MYSMLNNNNEADARTVLEVSGLTTCFDNGKVRVTAVDNISLSVKKGEILGIVGESGSGKSITALSIMQLIRWPGKIVKGTVLFDGIDLMQCRKEQMRAIRGNRIAMIFQDPSTSLNPSLTIGAHLTESMKYHLGMDKKKAWQRARELLDVVHIPHPQERLRQYPHQLSGGMRQRVMIAIALSCNPELLIADEPTTALDVTIQSQILDLILELRDKYGMSIIFITHDIGVISEIADNVAVMYCGKILAYGDKQTVLTRPIHPYLTALIQAMPRLDTDTDHLASIPGIVPNLNDLPKGCHFSSRCSQAGEQCRNRMPKLKQADTYMARCWKS